MREVLCDEGFDLSSFPPVLNVPIFVLAVFPRIRSPFNIQKLSPVSSPLLEEKIGAVVQLADNLIGQATEQSLAHQDSGISNKFSSSKRDPPHRAFPLIKKNPDQLEVCGTKIQSSDAFISSSCRIINSSEKHLVEDIDSPFSVSNEESGSARYFPSLSPLKIISWNTRALKVTSKRAALNKFIKNCFSDIVLTQDIKMDAINAVFIKSPWSSRDIGWDFVESMNSSWGVLTMWDNCSISVINFVELPKEKKIVGCKLVFTVKCEVDGSIVRYKARLLTLIDLFYQMDVKNVFLNGELEEELFIDLPPEFEKKLADDFQIKDLGTLKYFLSMEFARSKSDILVNQSSTTLRRSTSGYCSFGGGNLVSWQSKKQSVIARSRSRAEAEFRALALGISEGIWIRRLLEEWRFTQTMPMHVYCDNKASNFHCPQSGPS
ncbi:Lysosomal alpha-mannosidase [Cucumis melo var. makuwa]|uniref:Lysosomal alpha-mannosidase n=1 Tax=Cucumis melo var. makuwa TaxID=1194695 RepID=A0A5D3BRU2_CUCMM|nr:Lysosomal alpha-mannosidase [Cucumis melo var. makuwa]